MNSMTEAAIIINDIEVSYYIKPEEEPALTVIFIHGFPFNKTIWSGQLEQLPANVQGIAYDVRGHGNTPAGQGYFSIDLFAKDLLLFINRLNLRRVVLCGISMGGYIALRAAERSAGEIAGLILCDTTSLADSNEAKLARFAGIETILQQGLGLYTDNFVKKLFSPAAYSENPGLITFIKKVIMQNEPGNVCAALLALASRTDTTAGLKAIHVPVLVLRGADDQIISNEQAQQLSENIEGARLELIPQSGHLPNLENPVYFNNLVSNFLTGLNRQAV